MPEFQNIFLSIAAQTKINGTGSFHMPNSEIPPVCCEDWELKLPVLYLMKSTQTPEVVQALIRRLHHSEMFAKGLEKELEKYRQ